MASRNFVDRHEDFPGDAASVAALQSRVAGLIRADKFGADISETMDLAYEQLVAEGVIRPTRDETPPVPPSLRGSTGTTSNVDAEQMSDEDLKRLLVSHGMLSR
jgi:hypothetical protein